MTKKTIRPFKAFSEKSSFQQTITLPKSKHLAIEIGCGVGYHPISYAQKNPASFLIAIEKTAAKFAKFNRRYENHSKPQNLLPVHSNAVNWIAENIAPNQIDHYFILYPNPYPKLGQQNKRWHAMPFMSYLIKTLKPKGRLTLATNISSYKEEAVDFMTNQWSLDLVECQKVHNSSRTHFEKKYLESKQICWNMVFEKKKPSLVC